MLPSRRQYEKWSLPSKWSFLGAVASIPLGLVSLLLTLLPFASADPVIAERNRALLQAAQELRRNHEWLSDLSSALPNRSRGLPAGALRTDGLSRLVEQHHDWLVSEAYGEEKYIFQQVLVLRDLSLRLGSPTSRESLTRTMSELEYTLDDIHFLNNFLLWYIRPHLERSLSSTQLYSLGWNGLPGDKFQPSGARAPSMKRFVHDEKPIVDYSSYLGLID